MVITKRVAVIFPSNSLGNPSLQLARTLADEVLPRVKKETPNLEKMNQEIIIWFIIDENISKIMKKSLFFSENQKNDLRKSIFLSLN